jgi:hypothetical protein
LKTNPDPPTFLASQPSALTVFLLLVKKRKWRP